MNIVIIINNLILGTFNRNIRYTGGAQAGSGGAYGKGSTNSTTRTFEFKPFTPVKFNTPQIQKNTATTDVQISKVRSNSDEDVRTDSPVDNDQYPEVNRNEMHIKRFL